MQGAAEALGSDVLQSDEHSHPALQMSSRNEHHLSKTSGGHFMVCQPFLLQQPSVIRSIHDTRLPPAIRFVTCSARVSELSTCSSAAESEFADIDRKAAW